MLQLSAVPYALQVVIYIIIFFVGAAVFSYLHIVVKRLPNKETLFGREAFASSKRSLRRVLMELLGGVLAVVCVLYYQISFSCLVMFLLFCVLAVITGIDADTQEIPPVLNVIIFLLGLLSILAPLDLHSQPSVLERVIGMLAISLPLYLIVLVIPDGFGGGDIKMMFAAGFLLGWKGVLFAFFVGVILGGGYGAFLLISKQKSRKEHFALGPFLSVGVAISAYAGIGAALVNQYISYVVRSMTPQ